MRGTGSTRRTGCHYKVMQSPVGSLTLIASENGLAAILWENDDPRRVPLTIAVEDATHPVLVETERQLREYFAGTRLRFSLPLDFGGTERGFGGHVGSGLWGREKNRL